MSDHASHLFTKKTLAQFVKQGKDFTAHSIFAPSLSSTWAYCAGSLIPHSLAPDRPSYEAAEGTVAHYVAEQWLKHDERPDELVGTIMTVDGFDVEITTEMLDWLVGYVDYCQNQKGIHFTERRVDFSDLTPIPNQKGTADYAVINGSKLIVTDLKYGEGVQVFAKDNTQAILYAYGFFREFDAEHHFKTIVIRIAQPRFDHYDVWKLTREELLEWAAWLKKRAYRAWRQNAKRRASEKACRWCNVQQDCGAYAVYLGRLHEGRFDDLTKPVVVREMKDIQNQLDDKEFKVDLIDPGKLTIWQKLKIVELAPLFNKWFEKIKIDIDNRVLAGEDIEGRKIIEGRSSRKFRDIENSADSLMLLGIPEEIVRPPGMIGIVEAEKELRKLGNTPKEIAKLLAMLTVKPPGKPTVVDASHPAPPMRTALEGRFDDLEADDE